MQEVQKTSILDLLVKNMFYLLILIGFFGYMAIRLYAYLVPVDNTTLVFKKEYCFLVRFAEQPKNDCFVKGRVRQDLIGKSYIFETPTGKEIYFNENVIDARMWEVNE